MKGTDCTPEQIEAASQFLEHVSKWRADLTRAECSRDDIVRTLAWYGALRFKAGRDDTGGTLEHPGAFTVSGKDVESPS